MSELKVTSLEQLKEYAKGTIVEFPPFQEEQTFCVRLTKPSMIDLISSGNIPNDLLNEASKLFMNGKITDEKGKELNAVDTVKKLRGIVDVLAETCFVEPTYKEFKETGIKLTDEQIIFLFQYTQGGVKKLAPFREEQGNIKSNINKSNLQQNTKRNFKNRR